MAYFYREKFKLSDLVALPKQPSKLVLLVEPEEYLRCLYHRYLREQNFEVTSCKHVDALSRAVRERQPDLLVLSTAVAEQLSILLVLLKKLRSSLSNLPIVTIGHNLSGQDLSRLMSVGISSHIDRKLTRPRDLVHVVKAILN